MALVIPIEAGKPVSRARRFAQACGYVAPVLTGAARSISRLSLDIAWLIISAAIRLFGRYMRFALTIAFLVSLGAVGVEFFHHWPNPRIAVVAALVSIASLGLREALYRLERRAYDYPLLWR